MGLALMLSGGGARAAYQTGVLSGIGKRRPDLATPLLTGVSAGGINLGFIAAYRGSFGEATAALRRRWLSLTTEEVPAPQHRHLACERDTHPFRQQEPEQR